MTWGSDNCTSVISTFINAVAIGDLGVFDSSVDADAAVTCHENDNAAYPTFEGVDNCSLVPLANGLF